MLLPWVRNLLPRPCDSFESTDYFFLGFTASISTPACISLSSWSNNWIDHQALDINLEIENSKCVWRQTPLDLKRDSHTEHKEQPQNVAKVFPFILKAKHKTLHVKRAWAVSRPKPDIRICDHDRHANIKSKPDINKNQLNFFQNFYKSFPLSFHYCFFT